MLRGGAYKPRTSPYSFQGLGREGLEILAEARAETGLPIVTEVLDPRLVELVGSYADVLQIGSRSMQNFPLLTEVGRFGKPVLLKRGFGATLEEWLYAAEYVALGGSLDIIFCERGIRTFSNGAYDRATLDLAGRPRAPPAHARSRWSSTRRTPPDTPTSSPASRLPRCRWASTASSSRSCSREPTSPW